MNAYSTHTTMSLGDLVMQVYDQYGSRHAEALIWFAIHGYLIVSPSSERETRLTHLSN